MTQLNLTIRRGTTFTRVVRWEGGPYVYRPIQSISKAAPCVIDVAAHGLPDSWRVAIVSAKGMTEINAGHSPPWANEFVKATKVTADKIELNAVNSSGFSDHTPNTGYVQFFTPVDLTGFEARMKVKDKVGGVLLLELSTTNNKIVIDNIAKTITLVLSATETEALTFTKGRYDLELVSSGGVVTTLLEGQIVVEQEVTTTV